MSQLSFASLHRPAATQVGTFGGSQTERRSLDFVVDGISLYSEMRASHYDFIGLLGWCTYEQDLESVQRLLLEVPTNVGGGRQSLFVCAECGDLGCGSITAAISNLGNRYVWADFAYENNYDAAMTDRESFASIGPFEFEASAYRRALVAALETRRS